MTIPYAAPLTWWTAPPPPAELVDACAAAYLTILACEPLADPSTAEMLADAKSWLDDLVCHGYVLSADEQRRFLSEMKEVDAMLGAVRQRLRDNALGG